MDRTIALLILAAILATVVADWYAAIVLGKASRTDRTIRSLRERADAATLLAVAMTLAFIVYADVLGVDFINGTVDFFIGMAALVAMGAPGIWWLILYRTGRLEHTDSDDEAG